MQSHWGKYAWILIIGIIGGTIIGFVLAWTLYELFRDLLQDTSVVVPRQGHWMREAYEKPLTRS